MSIAMAGRSLAEAKTGGKKPSPETQAPVAEKARPQVSNHRVAHRTVHDLKPSGPGSPLPGAVRARLAPVVGTHAADATRVHTDAAADHLASSNNARAVASGVDVFFAEGQYRPGTGTGDWLIAHEVAHVAQAQAGLLVRPAFKAAGRSQPGLLETLADRAADAVVDDRDLEKMRKRPNADAGPVPVRSVPAKGSQPTGLVTGKPAGEAQTAGMPGSGKEVSENQTAQTVAAETTAAQTPAAGKPATGSSTASGDGKADGVGPRDGLLMPEPATVLSPAEQRRVAGVQSRAKAASKSTAKAPPAKDNVTTAQAAVAIPQSEVDARAAEDVVASLSAKEKPSVEVEELCKKIRRLILEKRPADEEGVIDTRPDQVATEAGQGVETGVKKDVDAAKGSYGPMDAAPKGPQPSTPPGIDPIPGAAPTPAVAATSAAPDAVPADQVSLEADSQQMAVKAQNAGLNGDAAHLVNSGPVAEARAAQGEFTDLAKDGPDEALKAQSAALAQTDSDMATLQAKALASLKDARAGHSVGVRGQQDQLKSGEQDLRTRLSKQADDIFTGAQGRVQDLLREVPETAMRKWTTGLPPLTKTFNDDLKVVKGKVEDRHSGVGGWFVAGWDAVTGLPGWVKRAYDAAEIGFGDGVSTLIMHISSYVNGIIKIADAIISVARTDISAIFTKNLPDDQKAWAAEQLKVFNTKLDALHDEAESTRTSFNKDLIENAAGAVQGAREQIQKLRKAAQGLWGRFVDAVGRFLDDPVKFIIEGLLEILGISPPAFWAVVAKIQKVVSDIVDAPVRFANNLMSGIAEGFSLFFHNIGKHLLEGLLEWLLSGLKKEGISIEVPKELTLRNVVVFCLELLGISWGRIRKLLVEQLGEKAVGIIEKGAGVIYTLATKGLAGIFEDIKKMMDPQTIVDAIVDAAIRFISENLMVKVAQKIILMLNPAGAILAALEAIYRVLKWVFTNAARIFHLIEAVVNGLADVIAGNIGAVGKTVEKALAMLVAPVIDFLADYLGLGGLPGKVADSVKGLQTWVEGILRRVIKWLVDLGKKILAALGFKGKDDKDKKAAGGEVGEHVAFEGGGESHEVFIRVSAGNAVLMMHSEVTTVQEWLNDRVRSLHHEKTSADAKAKGPALIVQARNLADFTDKAADEVAVELGVPASDTAASPSPEKVAQDQKTVVQDEKTLVTVLQEIAVLFGVAGPVVVTEVVPRKPLRLQPPLGRRLIEDLAMGDSASEFRDTRQDDTLIQNLIATDASAFDQGKLFLPVPDEASLRSAPDVKALAGRLGKQTYVRRVDLYSGEMGFSLSAGYDAVAAGLVTGMRMRSWKQRVEAAAQVAPFVAVAAAGEGKDRFRPAVATGAAPYPQASVEPFTTAQYVSFFEAAEKIDKPNALEDFAAWLALGAAGRLSRVRPEGAHKYVITGGSRWEESVEDTRADVVDAKLTAAVSGAGGIVAFMTVMAKHGKAGEVAYAEFTDMWKRSANSEWLKDRFRDASSGMHEWIPSNYIPDTIAKAKDPNHFDEGAKWIGLHHELRVDTSLLIFEPGLWVLSGAGPEAAWVPQGHVGAVYVGDEPQQKYQNLFHDDLRRAFDGSTGIDSCIQRIRDVFEKWIWNGSGGRKPLHPLLRSKNGTHLSPDGLAAYQKTNYDAVASVFDSIASRYGGGAK
jgi:hypothetical protein